MNIECDDGLCNQPDCSSPGEAATDLLPTMHSGGFKAKGVAVSQENFPPALTYFQFLLFSPLCACRFLSVDTR